MVVALGPGKFYGSSLPRPRIYTDVKLNDERVDPPVPVMDPLMSWAQEAHWSMGGLSFTRHRLQGRIEGNVKKLRAEREKFFKKAQKEKGSRNSPVTPAAPVAVKRRRMMVVDEEEEEVVVEEEEEEEEKERREVRRTARKLGDDFDRVANEKKGSPVKGGGGAPPKPASPAVVGRKRGRGSDEEEVGEDVIKRKSKGKKVIKKNNGGKNERVAAKGSRTSPRLLAKRG